MNKNLIEKIAPQLTELMIKKMETLTEAWRKPWIADLAHGLPRNLRGTPYRGGNILMLLFLSEIAGYSTPLFMTFKQAKEEGLNIYSPGNHCACQLSRSAAGIDDTTVIIEIPHGQCSHLPRRTIRRQVLRQVYARTLLPLAHCVV